MASNNARHHQSPPHSYPHTHRHTQSQPRVGARYRVYRLRQHRSLALVVILLVVGAALLALGPVGSGASGAETGGAPAHFTGTVEDNGVDTDDDGQYELLEVAAEVTVESADEYRVYATLAGSGIDARTHTAQYLTAGVHTLTVHFSGQLLYDSARDGPYTVSLLLANHDILDRLKHETAAYAAEMFNPEAPEPATNGSKVQISTDTITITGTVFTTVIDIHRPSILFDYAPASTDTDTVEERATPPLRYRLQLEQLIAYDDTNRNHYYDAGDAVRASADILDADWTLDVRMIEGFETFEFELSAFVPFIDTNDGDTVGHGKIAVHLSSAVLGEDYSVQKFDIELLPDTELPGTHIALEQSLVDLSQQHIVAADEPLFVDAENALAPYPVDANGSGEVRFVQKIDGGDDRTADAAETHGFYRWSGAIELQREDGTEETTFRSSYHNDGETLSLYFCYPNPGVAQLYHDPSVGVVAANAPALVEEVINAVQHNPYLFSIGLLSAAITVYATLAVGKRKR